MSSSTTMVLPLLLFTLILSTISLAAAIPPRIPICDATRYKNLGLNISNFAFCDNSLSFPLRAKILVDSMTLSEKAAQLGNKAAGIGRLGIPSYNWWSEALHGVSDDSIGVNFTWPFPHATSFPTPICSGATYNETLWKAMGQVVSTEARAMFNGHDAGLTFWSPNINVVRDPRWGRTMETPGEDPFLIGRYAVNYVRGLQDVEGHETADDPNARPLKVSACCKHYAAYDVDHWFGPGRSLYDRLSFNANVTEQDMVETFVRPFEMCVKEGDVSSVMCSYNEVNGFPACGDARLLRGTIRDEWDFHGYIVSDCDSVEVTVDNQKFLDDAPEDAVAQSLRAGLDLDCGSTYPNYLESAAMRGLIRERDMDQAMINNYIVLLRLGYFDSVPEFDSLGPSDVCTNSSIDLATDAARQSMVLLKNNQVLPLSTKNISTIAVIGPHANATEVMLGNYLGKPCQYVAPMDALASYAKINYQMGCADVHCRNDSFIWPAVRATKAADATIILVGLNNDFEQENHDRDNLELPGLQNQLIRQVASVSKGPVVLVILSAGGLNVTEFDLSGDVDAIIWAGYPGMQGGQAIADVIFGNYNPGGRLPITWYHSDYLWQLPMISMCLRPIDELGFPGRTYKFFNGSIIYPFGYGMSYTQFTYTVTSTQKLVEKKLAFNQHCLMINYNQSAYIPPCQAALVDNLECQEADITLEIQVSNIGKIDGSEVVMVYSTAPDGIIGAPIKQLIGFQRVFVAAGASQTVTLQLSSCTALSIVTDSAYVALPEGEHTITVGNGDNAVEFPFHVYLKN